MRSLLPLGISVCYLVLELAGTTFVFGSKEESPTFPREMLDSWMVENQFGGLYGRSEMFSVVVLPDCEDNELVDATINSILLTANRNLLHEIVVLDKDCQGSGKDLKEVLGENFLDKPLIRVVRTELQELGELQSQGASNSTGEIILFVPAATLFPANWMSPIMRSLSDNFSSVVVPRLKKLSKGNWRFSANDPVYSPKMMFTKSEFELANIHSPGNKVPMFSSRIFATTRTWWKKISELSDPAINLIFKSSINLDISLRSWSCGGRVTQVEVSFGVAKVKTSQPSFEVRQTLLESWIDEPIMQYILKSSERLADFMGQSSSLFHALISKRKEQIRERRCDQKKAFTSKFYNELNEGGIIEYPRSQIVSDGNGLCFTLVGDKKNEQKKSQELRLTECRDGEDSQAFYVDKKSKFTPKSALACTNQHSLFLREHCSPPIFKHML